VVVGKDIDLLLFFSKWITGLAVQDDEALGFKRSLQVFDAQGIAVIKIYALAETDMVNWEQLVQDFTAPVQPDVITILPAAAPAVYAQNIDTTAFLQDWAALQDTHDFFPMLARYKASRVKALEIAEGRYTRRVDNNCVKTLLEQAAGSGLEIMVFVSNHGSIEIHTGAVHKIVEIPGWINVMDPDFNLHLKAEDIAQCWVVEKPSVDGTVTSIEVFDARQEMIVQFFGRRKPGLPELKAWKELVKSIISL
jgi:putative hemin transport protein